jgi:hypothetical protein
MSPKDANMLAEMKLKKMLTRTPSDPEINEGTEG